MELRYIGNSRVFGHAFIGGRCVNVHERPVQYYDRITRRRDQTDFAAIDGLRPAVVVKRMQRYTDGRHHPRHPPVIVSSDSEHRLLLSPPITSLKVR